MGSVTVGLAAMNWNTIVCLALMSLVSIAICAWASYELNWGGVVEQRQHVKKVVDAGDGNAQESVSIEVVEPYSIFESKPALVVKSHTISDYDAAIEMGQFQPYPFKPRIVNENANRIRGNRRGPLGRNDSIENSNKQQAKTGNLTAFVGPSRTASEFPPNLSSCDQDRARDRRVLLGLKGINNG